MIKENMIPAASYEEFEKKLQSCESSEAAYKFVNEACSLFVEGLLSRKEFALINVTLAGIFDSLVDDSIFTQTRDIEHQAMINEHRSNVAGRLRLQAQNCRLIALQMKPIV